MAVFSRLDEAEVARGVLEADGIPVALLDAQVAALGLGPAIGGVRLLVPAWAEARSLELLTLPAVGPLDQFLAALTPPPGSLATVPPPPWHTPVPPPPAPQPGPVAVRVAFWAALVLLLAALLALR